MRKNAFVNFMAPGSGVPLVRAGLHWLYRENVEIVWKSSSLLLGIKQMNYLYSYDEQGPFFLNCEFPHPWVRGTIEGVGALLIYWKWINWLKPSTLYWSNIFDKQGCLFQNCEMCGQGSGVSCMVVALYWLLLNITY